MRMRCRSLLLSQFPLVCEQGSNTSASAAPPPSQVQLHLQGDPENQKELVQPKVSEKRHSSCRFSFGYFLYKIGKKTTKSVFNSNSSQYRPAISTRNRKNHDKLLAGICAINSVSTQRHEKNKSERKQQSHFSWNRPWGREQAGDEVYINHFYMYIEEHER